MAFQPDPKMEYYLISVLSGKVLDVCRGSERNGADIIQYHCHGGSNQRFLFEENGDGTFRIVSVKSNKVFDVKGDAQKDMANIVQHEWHGGDNQRFAFEELDGGFFKIEAKVSGKVLDVEHSSTENKADIVQHEWHGGDNQKFRVVPAYISSKEVYNLIRKQLKEKLQSKVSIQMADKKYFITPLWQGEQIISKSNINSRKWTEEKYDCDDFAICLKADFTTSAYKDGARRYPYCMGMVWGMLPDAHAINWMLNEDMQIRFIEPQKDKVFLPRETDKGIWFIYA